MRSLSRLRASVCLLQPRESGSLVGWAQGTEASCEGFLSLAKPASTFSKQWVAPELKKMNKSKFDQLEEIFKTKQNQDSDSSPRGNKTIHLGILLQRDGRWKWYLPQKHCRYHPWETLVKHWRYHPPKAWHVPLLPVGSYDEKCATITKVMLFHTPNPLSQPFFQILSTSWNGLKER